MFFVTDKCKWYTACMSGNNNNKELHIQMPHPVVNVDQLIALFLYTAYSKKKVRYGFSHTQIEGAKPLPMNDDGYTAAVAKELKLERLPEAQLIIKAATKGASGRGSIDIWSMLETLNNKYTENIPAIVEPLFDLLNLQLDMDKRLFYALPEEWAAAQKEQRAMMVEITVNEREYQVGVVSTLETDMNPMLHYNKKVAAHIGVVVGPNNVYRISKKPGLQFDLTQPLQIIQVEEKRAGGNASWVMAEPFQDIFSTESVLSPEAIVNAISVGLNREIWENNCPPTGCAGESCYFYEYQLGRCQDRRDEE